MLSFLKNHPFAVEAFFERSLVLTYAVPKKQLQGLIPECLELDIFEDAWAFVAIALVQTKNLRPKGFPKVFGNDFFLVGYRVFVRYTNAKGKRLRGLFILKSESNQRRMQFFGNIFTHYNYTTTDIESTVEENQITVESIRSNFRIAYKEGEDTIPLPENSPFDSWKVARRFAGPLPFTFTYDEQKKEVLIIEGVRQNWKPEPVRVLEDRLSFLRTLKLPNAILANAFVITDIPYHWKKGKIETWQR